MGPMKQMKSLCFHPAFQVYALAMVGTLYFALSVRLSPYLISTDAQLENAFLTLIMIVVQICAAVWYGASFIPFAQECIRGSAGAILPV